MPRRGRPSLPLGSWGSISVNPAPTSAADRPVYYARALFRDADGVTRPVLRSGQTEAAAKRRLIEDLTKRTQEAPQLRRVSVTPSSTVGYLADLWFEQKQAEWSQNTRSRYLVNVRHIKEELGHLELRDLNRGWVSTALQHVLTSKGHHTARQVRSTLTGLVQLALQYDAIDYNPVRDALTIRAPRGAAKLPNALTPAEVDEVLALVSSNEPERTKGALLDVVTWMLGTGCRIGEALAASFDNIEVTTGSWEVTGTVVRKHGGGLLLQDHTKTEAGRRRIALPRHLGVMAERRQVQAVARWGDTRPATQMGLLFPSAVGTLWHPTQVGKLLRRALGGQDSPFAHVTTHTFRRTAITRLDEAGMSPREIAVWAGHADPSLTQKTYMARNIVSTRPAEVLRRE